MSNVVVVERNRLLEPGTPARSGWIGTHAGPILIMAILCSLHAVLICAALGGWSGLTSDAPLLQADFGFHFAHALASRDFLRESGFTAGYDPGFMAGFPMSVISGTSSAWATVAVSLFGGSHPAVAFKGAVLAMVVVAPLLVVWASVWFGLRPTGVAWSVFFYLIYVWTDFPSRYIYFGMVSFYLAVPLSLVAVAALVRYLETGGFVRWGWAALVCSALFCVHLTSPIVVAPAGLLAYGLKFVRSRRGLEPFPVGRQAGFWALAVVILAVNAWWWLPGYWLRATLGATDITFIHPESVWKRLGEIVTTEAPIQTLLFALGIPGLIWLGSLRPVAATGLGGMIAAGFAWGYLAGWSRVLDAFQPGRQTYACYSGLCIVAGYAVAEVGVWLRDARPGRTDRWIMAGFVLLCVRMFLPSLEATVRVWALAPEPMLSSRPLPILEVLIKNIQQHVQPGERLLFEETGRALANNDDPFFGRHLSPVLPWLTGAEVLGGPYLHTPVTTNFTQFGEGKLFDKPNWGRDQFVRYARLYRPSAIACWTKQARAFCKGNPDLIRVIADDGVIVFGRVLGFEGATIQGSADVEASTNRLVVRNAVPDSTGLVVLRYHATPCLVVDPPLPIEPIYREQDPVPFIGLRPTGSEPITIRMALPPVTGWLQAPAVVKKSEKSD